MAAPITTLGRDSSGHYLKDQVVPLLNNSATKYGIPLSILTGVLQIETSFGANVKTSTAGAQGPFQFLPSTAAKYQYPLTNSPTVAQFQQQADAAAHYLSDLFHQTGSWETALQHYSGGGYGASQVQQASGTNLQQSEAVPSNIIPSPNISSPISGIVNIAELLTSSAFWIRLGEAIAGIILIAMGLRSLTGSTTTPVSVAASAAKVAKHV